MIRTAVLVSGGGANLQALLDKVYFDELPQLKLAAVISSAEGVYALERAQNAGIPTYVVDRTLFPNNASFCNALLCKLRDLDISLVVCAGFTEHLSYPIVRFFKHSIINVQPALFPAFCGGDTFNALRAVEETLRLGVRVTGATAYFMDEEDTGFGPIIAQRATEVLPDDTAATLSDRVMRLCEWPALVEAVSRYCRGELRVENGRVRIGAPEPAQDEASAAPAQPEEAALSAPAAAAAADT